MKSKGIPKIDVISGFTGAGKTTLINKLLEYLPSVENVVILENEFGEIGIDGSILKEAGISVKEISGGCICCTLHGNFILAIRELMDKFSPDRIIVEPTGLGKLSDVLSALNAAKDEDHIFRINVLVSVLDPLRFDFYKDMFGEFFLDQLVETNTIALSRTQKADPLFCDRICVELKKINPDAYIIQTNWDEIPSKKMLELLEESSDSKKMLLETFHNHECACGPGHEHHHHEDHQEELGISSVSFFGSELYSVETFSDMLKELSDQREYGVIIRGKGYFHTPSGGNIRFDYVYQELNFHEDQNDHEQLFVFIGKHINEAKLKELFSAAS